MMYQTVTKKVALLMTSYIAITATVFANNTIIIEPFSPTVTPLTQVTLTLKNKEGTVSIEDQLDEMSSSNSVIIDIPQTKDAEQILAQLKSKTLEEATLLDKTIKASIIAGSITVGAGLSWFYGPALAYSLAYNTSYYGALLVTPNASWWTLNMIIKPAAIDSGIYFATSGLVQAAIGTTSSALGYGLGKAGCAAYDATKYTTKTAINAVSSAGSWFKNKFWG